MIDAHAHLDHDYYDKDREDIINSLADDGIELVINTGSNIQSSRQCVQMAKKHDRIYATVGIHPLDADTYKGDQSLDDLRELAREDKVVAIGEVGLDNHYDDSPSKSVQEQAFIDQIELAIDLNLPLVVHSREAEDRTFEILGAFKEDHPDLPVLLHCYSYSVDMMKRYMEFDNLYMSLGGVTTFKNAGQTKDVARLIPLDRLLIETDSPYLTPDPYRGKRNEPKYTKIIGDKIAKLRGLSYEQIEDVTSQNAKRFYRIKD